MLCVVIVGPNHELVEQQIIQAAKKADIVELRLDLWQTVDLSFLKGLLQRHTIPMILSRRKGSEMLFELAALHPAFLDVEHDVPQKTLHELQKAYPQLKIILSYHNYKETPKDLDDIYHKMRTSPAYFYKIAVTAQNSIEAFSFMLWAKNKSCIPISMGPFGEPCRIIMRPAITFAALTDELASAPGQLSIDTLLNLRLTPHTALYGLIGYPVDKSISNITHNRAFALLGLDALYVKMNVAPAEVGQFLPLALAMGFRGLSATMPLKEEVMAHIDGIDPTALSMGAVNTLCQVDGKWHGFNTDGLGALNALEALGPISGKRIVVIGAGGAAKAIAVEAYRRGGKLFICNRDTQKAERLALKVAAEAYSLENIPKDYDIIINCTPSFMPIRALDIVPGSIAMDIHTRPKETEFLLEAQKKGCRVVYGYKMFIEQAIGQYSLWMQEAIQPERCRSILEEAATSVLGIHIS